MDKNEFASAQEMIFHMKLYRLAQDFYGLDLNTELGLMTFENMCHTYDISPGEDTLERCHTYPPDAHTYIELPVIKYDGWEYSDDIPPEDPVLSMLEPEQIEKGLDEWLQYVAFVTGKPATSVAQLKSGSPLSEAQLLQLNGVVSAETDYSRLLLLKKIWGSVLPEKEISILFKKQEEHLLAASTHEH